MEGVEDGTVSLDDGMMWVEFCGLDEEMEGKILEEQGQRYLCFLSARLQDGVLQQLESR